MRPLHQNAKGKRMLAEAEKIADRLYREIEAEL